MKNSSDQDYEHEASPLGVWLIGGLIIVLVGYIGYMLVTHAG